MCIYKNLGGRGSLTNSFIYHRSKKLAAKSCVCHTSKIAVCNPFVCHTYEPPRGWESVWHGGRSFSSDMKISRINATLAAEELIFDVLTQARLGISTASPTPFAGTGIFGAEARKLHGLLRFGIFHELLPDETRAMIFGHQHGDAKVDAKYVRIVPVG